MSETPRENSFECMQVQLIEHFDGIDPVSVCNVFAALNDRARRSGTKNFEDGEWRVSYAKNGNARVWVSRGKSEAGNTLRDKGYELEPINFKGFDKELSQVVNKVTLKVVEILHNPGSVRGPKPWCMLVGPGGRTAPKTGSSGR